MSEFISHVNDIETLLDYFSMILKRPVLPLPEEVVQLYQSAYDLLIRAVLTIFFQGVSELYKVNCIKGTELK
ncbi:hypothetical protein [Bacteroides sp.]|uniref:hypothetical protein n=1 Tax=Bacteroides sp. TaxID=29523 RepID=UPI0026047C35|nr:hypothetical protein [Bacteroides sp.]MDD3039209.1 hypothetical protein [Bacteroides sp.]